MRTTSVFVGEVGGGDRREGGAKTAARKTLAPDLQHRRPVEWPARVLFWLALVGTAVAAGHAGAAEPAKPAFVRNTPPQAAPTAFVETPATVETLRLLAAGGYALYLRHGTTNNAIPDRTPNVDLNDCSTQRPLTDEGRQLMARVGDSMRRANISIGDFYVSPMCRARQSAEAAFPALSPVVDNRLIYLANFTQVEKAPIVARTRQLLSLPVPVGANRLVLAHAPNLMDLMGYFPKEGTLVVFRPKGEQVGFEYVASLPSALWGDLLRQSQK